MTYNNYATPGLNGDDNNLFDFEAASSNTLWTGTHNGPAPQAQTAQAEKATHVMPLTKSEIEAILAVRASNAQNSHHPYSLVPPEPNANFSGFEEPGAYGACFNYDGAEIPTSTNVSDFDMPDYGNAPLNTLDGFGAFDLPHFEEPADVFGAIIDCAPNVTNQSETADTLSTHSSTPINQSMKQAVDNKNISNRVAFSPIQTEESIRQPEHLGSVVQGWCGKCLWPECTSRAVFKTRASFNMHFTNVHTTPLLCSTANCPHKTPFGRLSDLRRHKQSVHSTKRSFVCTVSSCDARIKEFARKDHLAKHTRERHDNYFCPLNHCPRSTKSSFAKPEEVVEHIKTEHGLYECAIKACAHAPSSKFSWKSLHNHLRNHHGTPNFIKIETNERTDERLLNTVIEADLYWAPCSECKICMKRDSVTKEKA